MKLVSKCYMPKDKQLLVFFLNVFVFAMVDFQAMGQTYCDTIIHITGKNIPAKVVLVSATDISYKEDNSKEIKVIKRKFVERIKYCNGKIEIFNKPVLQMIDENRWEAVLITENKNDVENLYEYGIVKSVSSSEVRSKRAAKKSATIIIQKKAANMGANIILITKAFAVGGYGEVPGYVIEGIAYGFRPPEERKREE